MIVDISMKQNSLKAWVLAARPKTLSGAAVPVMLGGAYAWHLVQDVAKMEWMALALCFRFAFLMQIDANFINDYYDCLKGRDNEERLGPLRACQQGWITMGAMRIAIAVTTLLACVAGLPLVYYGGWELIPAGIACVLFCFLYTTTLAQRGMGDLLVLVFFGIVPTVLTTYVTVHSPQFTVYSPQLPWNVGVATGLVTDCLLLVNNYRDIDNDRNSGKKTLVVRIGKPATEYLYMMLTPIALVMVLLEFGFSSANMILAFIVYFLHIGTWNQMRRIGKGRALNEVLGKTASNIFIYGVITSLIIIGIIL